MCIIIFFNFYKSWFQLLGNIFVIVTSFFIFYFFLDFKSKYLTIRGNIRKIVY